MPVWAVRRTSGVALAHVDGVVVDHLQVIEVDARRVVAEMMKCLAFDAPPGLMRQVAMH